MEKKFSINFGLIWCGFLPFFMVLWFSGSVTAQLSVLTPGEVVKLWLTVYPENLDRAASMTTLNFRQGVPRKDWASSQEAVLAGLQIKYGRGRILYEDIRGNRAKVILRVRISSWMWSGFKDELYSLVKGEEGLWFIDRVDEYVPN